jgi:hypothetical protein
MTKISVNAVYDGYPVRGFIHVPDSNPSSADLIVLFHGTISSPNVTPLTAAEKFFNIALDQFGLNFGSRLIYSVAYPQDAIPGWTPEAASALYPGLDLSTFYLGDNLPYVQAALGWAQAQLTDYLATNGVTIARNKIYAFGHSQGALLAHRLNRLYTLDGFVSNAPGPIDLLDRCSVSESQGDDNLSCAKLKAAFGSTAVNPSVYENVSLKNYLNNLQSPILYTQARNDSNPVQVSNMINIVQPGIEACTTCAPATFKYYLTGGHDAFVRNKETQYDIRTFLGFLPVSQPSFPAFLPTARNFQLGEYPVKTYRAMSGAVVRRSFGNRAFNYTLDLEYQNVFEFTVNNILAHYNNQGGSALGFTVPPEVFSGYSGTLQGKVRTPFGIEWLYAEPPSVSSVIAGISSVTVKLIGEMR